MYTEFYKLSHNPFEITPDPRFLFSTKRTKEALATLYYGVRQRKGFVVLTGEAGTGKTLLIRCILRIFQYTDVASAYVFNSRLSVLEFFECVANDLGLAASGKQKGEILRDINQYLLARHQKKLTTVLVVDEAHLLSTEILEEIRLLSNLETADTKLLQIVLIGQPELDEKLDSFELRQLKQRVALHAYLEPFDFENTREYIKCRLQVAGASPHASDLFPEETIARIHHFSQGIPRLINTLSDNALITGFARQLTRISPSVIDEVADDLRLRVFTSRNPSLAFEEKNGPGQALIVGQNLLRLSHQQ